MPNAAAQPYKVYIVFHGLWTFETRKNRILAHTPFSEDHKVCAGYFVHHDTTVEDKTVSMSPCHGELKGVTYGSMKDFDPGKNPLVENAGFLSHHAHKRFIVIDLGKPVQIHSVRNVPVGTTHQTPFAGTHGENLHPAAVSMVQVFEYTAKDPHKVALTSVDVKPRIDTAKRIVTLHIHAEPDGMTHRFHAMQAYARMAEMFGLQIIPIAPLFIGATNPNIDGLDVHDMKSLKEHAATASMGVGEKGENCDALVIDNAKLTGSNDPMADKPHD